MRLASAIAAVVAAWSTGCVTPLYDWGAYEASIARMYDGSDFNPSEEIDELSDEIESTVAVNKRVPPGKHAHLGYLYVLVGDHAAARRHLEAEKAAFPESSPFMDRLLGQIK